jgi:hypothetical protein
MVSFSENCSCLGNPLMTEHAKKTSQKYNFNRFHIQFYVSEHHLHQMVQRTINRPWMISL